MMGPESQRAVTVPLQQLGQRHHVHEVVIVEVAPPLLVRLQEIFELLLHLAAQGQPGPRVRWTVDNVSILILNRYTLTFTI